MFLLRILTRLAHSFPSDLSSSVTSSKWSSLSIRSRRAPTPPIFPFLTVLITTQYCIGYFVYLLYLRSSLGCKQGLHLVLCCTSSSYNNARHVPHSEAKAGRRPGSVTVGGVGWNNSSETSPGGTALPRMLSGPQSRGATSQEQCFSYSNSQI